MTPMYGTVTYTSQLSPSMVRVAFGGAGLDSFTPTGFTDEYINALFLPDGVSYSPPFDIDSARALEPNAHPRPRRFTVRNWDPESRLLTIDFVTHGEAGYAGRWAQSAGIGTHLQMSGPSGGYRPNEEADWYLLAGDESAMPAIARSLEQVPTSKPCVVFVVVDDVDHEVAMNGPSGIELSWLHRSSAPSPESLLRDAVADLRWQQGTVDVFVHGEAGEVRATRRHLIVERGLDRDAMSVSPYWRRDHDDEDWRAIKRQWLTDQENDI